MARIYFATNRRPNRKVHPTDFGKKFSDDGLANLRFGVAEVDGAGSDRSDGHRLGVEWRGAGRRTRPDIPE